jgi:hypothetical protein
VYGRLFHLGCWLRHKLSITGGYSQNAPTAGMMSTMGIFRQQRFARLKRRSSASDQGRLPFGNRSSSRELHCRLPRRRPRATVRNDSRKPRWNPVSQTVVPRAPVRFTFPLRGRCVAFLKSCLLVRTHAKSQTVFAVRALMFDMSAYQRARAARLKSAGICVVCGSAQAMKNRTRCRACGADGSRRTLKWIARRTFRRLLWRAEFENSSKQSVTF